MKKIIEAIILIASLLINVYAVAWGIVLYNFICIFINIKPSKRLVDYGLLEQLKDVFPTLIISLFMGVLVYACELLPLSNLLRLAVQILVGTVSYYVFCKLLKLDSLVYVSGYFQNVIKKEKNEK